jgi:serine/threonine protein kinase
MSVPLSDNARSAAEHTAIPDKEADDPRILLTPVGQPIPPPCEQLPRTVGEYEVLERLGCGGMGKVYKARHCRLNKLVALKLMPAFSLHPHEAAARFQREMKAVGALDHPNVVEAHDAGEQSGIVYLAMKLIDGVDLERLVNQRGPLPIAEACALVRQAALGLHYLHERGLIHRDVKPSNLMRTPDGTVKVLDLGLARWRVEAVEGHGLTGMGLGIGTPDFLAPEQIEQAAEADARADLYGLGGTLFYLLTGRVLFADHKSLFLKLEAHRSKQPPDVRMLRHDVPEELAALLHRLLAKKPEDRLTTAAEAAVALAPFAGAPSPPDFSPLPATTEFKPRKPRWRWLAAAAAVMMLTALVLLLALAPHTSRPSSSPPPIEIKSPEPLQTVNLDVRLTRAVDGKSRLLGEDIFVARAGDTVTVAARLSRQAYAFLIAFRPDGKAELCYPESENQPPPKTDRLAYPMPPKGDRYGLNDGTGLMAFALAASSESLPSFTDWWQRCQDCPWTKEEAHSGVVYRANGEDPVDVLDVEGPRSKGAEAKGETPMARLALWLRRVPEIETVQVLGFAVEPSGRK